MKYNIEGLDQRIAIEFGLDVVDLVLLRWFVDFSVTNKMRRLVEGGEIYYWIDYKSVIKELPILDIKKVAVARRFQAMASKGVLIHKTHKDGGTFSYYGFSDDFSYLLYEPDPSTSKYEGYDFKVPPVALESANKDSSINSSTINSFSLDSQSRESDISPRRARTTFTKPTLDEVRAYCIQRDNGIDPLYWLDYYEARGWMVGKTKMQDWKAAVRTWERNKQATEQKPSNERRSTFNDSIPLV